MVPGEDEGATGLFSGPNIAEQVKELEKIVAQQVRKSVLLRKSGVVDRRSADNNRVSSIDN